MSSNNTLTKHDSGNRYCQLLNRTVSIQAPTKWIIQHESELKEMYNVWRTIVSHPGTFNDFCLYLEKGRVVLKSS